MKWNKKKLKEMKKLDKGGKEWWKVSAITPRCNAELPTLTIHGSYEPIRGTAEWSNSAQC